LSLLSWSGSDTPAPTAYNPKLDSTKRNGGVFPKSERFSSASKQGEVGGGSGTIFPIPFPLSTTLHKTRSSSSSSINRLARTPAPASFQDVRTFKSILDFYTSYT